MSCTSHLQARPTTEDGGEEDEDGEGVEEAPPETRIEVEIPRMTADLGNGLHYVKLPNFLSVETRYVCHLLSLVFFVNCCCPGGIVVVFFGDFCCLIVLLCVFFHFL